MRMLEDHLCANPGGAERHHDQRIASGEIQRAPNQTIFIIQTHRVSRDARSLDALLHLR